MRPLSVHISPTKYASKLIKFATPVQTGEKLHKHEEFTHEALQYHLQKQKQPPSFQEMQKKKSLICLIGSLTAGVGMLSPLNGLHVVV